MWNTDIILPGLSTHILIIVVSILIFNFTMYDKPGHAY